MSLQADASPPHAWAPWSHARPVRTQRAVHPVPQRSQPVERSNATADARACVVLADGHELVRAGLRAALTGDDRLHVVGEARDEQEAIRVATRLQPDLLVIDVDLGGLPATRILQRTCPKTRVLLLGTSAEPDLVLEALRSGVDGFLLKSASLAEVRASIGAVLRGELPLDKRLTRNVLMRVVEAPCREAAPARVRLSGREVQVLACIARGHTNRQIAAELCITQSTVKIHVEHILTKLEVHDRTEAAVCAIEHGYISRGTNG
jgi:DNA-binding NarL/FixJ family response regulator